MANECFLSPLEATFDHRNRHDFSCDSGCSSEMSGDQGPFHSMQKKLHVPTKSTFPLPVITSLSDGKSWDLNSHWLPCTLSPLDRSLPSRRGKQPPSRALLAIACHCPAHGAQHYRTASSATPQPSPPADFLARPPDCISPLHSGKEGGEGGREGGRFGSSAARAAPAQPAALTPEQRAASPPQNGRAALGAPPPV